MWSKMTPEGQAFPSEEVPNLKIRARGVCHARACRLARDSQSEGAKKLGSAPPPHLLDGNDLKIGGARRALSAPRSPRNIGENRTGRRAAAAHEAEVRSGGRSSPPHLARKVDTRCPAAHSPVGPMLRSRRGSPKVEGRELRSRVPGQGAVSPGWEGGSNIVENGSTKAVCVRGRVRVSRCSLPSTRESPWGLHKLAARAANGSALRV